MKKLIATLLAIVMLAALSVGAMAANNFTQSVEKPGAPTVEIVNNAIECTQQTTSTEIQDLNDKITSHEVVLTATAYKDRDTIDLTVPDAAGKTAKGILEEAKQKLADASSIHDLVDVVPLDAKATEVLDISLIENVQSTRSIVNLPQNAKITIRLTRSIPNFEALLHYKDDGSGYKWVKVEGATLVGNILSFPVDSLSPFAIVVKNTSSGPSSPATGASAPIACAVGAVVFGVAGAALLKKGKEN